MERIAARTRLLALFFAIAALAGACGWSVHAADEVANAATGQLFTATGVPLVIRTETLLRNDIARDRQHLSTDTMTPTMLELLTQDAPGAIDEARCSGGQATCSMGAGLCPAAGCGTSAGGTVRKQTDGTILFTPKAGWSGNDTFRYRDCITSDGISWGIINCDDATAAVTVHPLRVDAQADQISAQDGSASTTVDALVANDRLRPSFLRAPLVPTDVTVSLASARGGVVIYDATSGAITYLAPQGVASATDSFAYTVCHKGTSVCAKATVAVAVNALSTTTTTTGESHRPSSTTTSTTAPAPPDGDEDGVEDDDDNCPADANADQLNTDNQADGGDACDTDDDDDTFLDGADNCPVWPNLQSDNDSDGLGDDCDADDDDDLIVDTDDNCPMESNPLQEDGDTNGIGDACDSGGGPGGILTQITAAGDEWLEQPFVQAIAYGDGADQVDFEITNNDPYDHDFWIDLDTSGTVNAGDVFEVVAASDVTTFTATLAVGSYSFTCDLHPGMDGTLTVA